MNTKIRTLVVSTSSVVLALCGASEVSAQGPLTPPGPPAPTMKTLDQIEPRTPIGSAPFTITEPGSYYLTGNIIGAQGLPAISIESPNVTLDLNGFLVEGSVDDYYGILIPYPSTNITVRNGTISAWSEAGVFDYGGTFNLVLDHLTISDNFYGITTPSPNAVVRDCFAVNNALEGINCSGSATISDSTASGNEAGGIVSGGGAITGCMIENNGSYGVICSGVIVSACTIESNSFSGIYSTLPTGLITGCSVNYNGEDGIDCAQGKVAGCMVNNNAANGINAYPAIVSGCFVEANQYNGIAVGGPGNGSKITGNVCIGNNPGGNGLSAGIIVFGSNNNLIEDNNLAGNGYAGIDIDTGTGNVVVKNSVAGDGANNYAVAAGNDLGPVGTAAASTSPWANITH